MNYLGLNIGSVDPSATLIINTEIVCHVEEERFLRIKKAYNQFPKNAIKHCLENFDNDHVLKIGARVTYQIPKHAPDKTFAVEFIIHY